MIILKQIPHALGYDLTFEGSESFFEPDGSNTFSSLMDACNLLTPGALLIAAVSMGILIFWDAVLTKKHKLFQILQGPIVVVLVGILFNYLFQTGALNFSLSPSQIVDLPVSNGLGEFVNQFTFPDFSILKFIKLLS